MNFYYWILIVPLSILVWFTIGSLVIRLSNYYFKDQGSLTLDDGAICWVVAIFWPVVFTVILICLFVKLIMFIMLKCIGDYS